MISVQACIMIADGLDGTQSSTAPATAAPHVNANAKQAIANLAVILAPSNSEANVFVRNFAFVLRISAIITLR